MPESDTGKPMTVDGTTTVENRNLHISLQEAASALFDAAYHTGEDHKEYPNVIEALRKVERLVRETA